MSINILVEKRKKLLSDLNNLLESNQELDDESRSKFDVIENQVKGLDDLIERAKKQESSESRQASLEEELKRPTKPAMIGVDQSFSRQEERDLSKFDLAKAVIGIANNSLDGIEREMVDEGLREARNSGFVPQGHIISRKVLEKRQLVAGTPAKGGDLVETMKYPVLDALFHENALARVGATTLEGLEGNLDVPRIVKAADPAHKSEISASDEYELTFTQISLTPKRLPSHIPVSNQLLKQSSTQPLQAVLDSTLASAIMESMQNAVINGSGGIEPEGILKTTGIGAVELGPDANTGGPLTWQAIVDLETVVAQQDAARGMPYYLMNAHGVGSAKSTKRFSDQTDSRTIITESSMDINGYPYTRTNSVPSNLSKGTATNLNAIIFANFADLFIANWGGLEILVNPFSLDTQGMTRITAAIYYDSAVVRPASFSAIQDLI